VVRSDDKLRRSDQGDRRHPKRQGFVETSGHTVDFTGIRVDTSAPVGKTGTWLVDPTDLTVGTAAAATISTNLATTNVTLQTNADGTTSGPGVTNAGPGDINVNAPISWSSGNTLALNANHAININGPITIAGAGGLNLSAAFDPLLTSVPMLFFSLGNSVQFTGTPNIGRSLTINGQPYTLLYSMIDVQNINASNASLSGNFALAKSLDTSTLTNWMPIGTNSAGQVLNGTGFTGAFEGLGNTIANLKISPAPGNLVGLFGISDGTIRNVGLLNETVTAAANVTPSGIFVGGLVGMNAGTIAQSFTKGIVNGGSDSFFVGGLVGWNSGSVFQSYATSSVSGTGSVGGLITTATVQPTQILGSPSFPGDRSFHRADFAHAAVRTGGQLTGHRVGHAASGRRHRGDTKWRHDDARLRSAGRHRHYPNLAGDSSPSATADHHAWRRHSAARRDALCSA